MLAAPSLRVKWPGQLASCAPERFAMPVTPRGWPVYGVNSQCVHNELIALLKRTIVPLNCAVPRELVACLKWLPNIPLQPEHDPLKLVAMFGQSKRKRYRSLYGLTPLDHADPWNRITAFTKRERIPIAKRGKPKAPRLIQARTPTYNWILAAYTKPLEHHLYQWKINGWRVIAKGLNLHERAQTLHSIWSSFTNPVCISMDASDWDGHCGKLLLQVEHKYYRMVFGEDPLLCSLLRAQLRNKGRTLCGLTYELEGARMSGDMNTALGNCVLAALLAIYSLESLAPNALRARRAHVFCDGDDTLIIAERSVAETIIHGAPRLYQALGHALRIDGVANSFGEIEFCQHKPLCLSNGKWVMVPNPQKVLQTAFMATGDNSFNPAYYGTLWDLRARIHKGVPVYDRLFRRLATWNSARLNCQAFFGFEHCDPHISDAVVTESQRRQFAEAWEFPIELQLQWEEAQVVFDSGTQMGPPEVR